MNTEKINWMIEIGYQRAIGSDPAVDEATNKKRFKADSKDFVQRWTAQLNDLLIRRHIMIETYGGKSQEAYMGEEASLGSPPGNLQIRESLRINIDTAEKSLIYKVGIEVNGRYIPLESIRSIEEISLEERFERMPGFRPSDLAQKQHPKPRIEYRSAQRTLETAVH